MFFKLLFYFIIFWVVSRYIRRIFLPSGNRNQQFNPFQNRGNRSKRNIDQIEDADYEDLSDKN
jgi:hypothetical protein